MSKDRKNRSDSKLDALSEEHREAVFAKCEPMSLEAGARWLQSEFDIAISQGRLAAWLSKVRKEKSFRAVLDNLREDAKFSESVTKCVGDSTKLGDASAALLQQMVFGLLRLPTDQRDPEAIALLMGHALKVRDQELKAKDLELSARRVKLLESAAKSAKEKLEALTKANKGGLTADTLKQIEEAASLL